MKMVAMKQKTDIATVWPDFKDRGYSGARVVSCTVYKHCTVDKYCTVVSNTFFTVMYSERDLCSPN